MRQAALHRLIIGLLAEHAHTRAWHDNMLAFSMSRDQWQTVRRGDIELYGITPVRQFLGLKN